MLFSVTTGGMLFSSVCDDNVLTDRLPDAVSVLDFSQLFNFFIITSSFILIGSIKGHIITRISRVISGTMAVTQGKL